MVNMGRKFIETGLPWHIVEEAINRKVEYRIFTTGKPKKHRFVNLTPRAKQYLDTYLDTR